MKILCWLCQRWSYFVLPAVDCLGQCCKPTLLGLHPRSVCYNHSFTVW